LIYTEADWVDLLAKIATNSALSKQLLGDDVTEENMNERLGMLLLRKRRELAEQSRVKPMTKTQQRDYMRDFFKNNSTSVYNQGWTMKKVPAAPSFPTDVSVHAATFSAPADISVPAISPAHAAASVPAETVVHTTESTEHVSTASEHVSTAPTVAVPTPSSSRTHWVDLLAKIATNSALSKQLLGDDVTEENMNERLGMLLLRKRRELAEQSRVKPMTKTQQRDYMRDFFKNNSTSVYNQGWTMKKVPAAPSFPADVSVHAATFSAPADISVPAISPAHAAAS
nr:hypothetical protein [Tanacetum cinerariifolium]